MATVDAAPDLSAPAIEARGLGKRYLIQARRERTVLANLRRWVGGAPLSPLWALRRLDLTVRRGECVGIVGANGSGKTTLLMLLAGLSAPSEGTVEVRGTVSPFFRIGSGLYHELSVLDNIRAAAALFGMTPEELEGRLDAIVSFGGLERYLYARLGELSSGYQSRVSFSTALHSDIDLLLIDEVFAVGDLAFSMRCLERMESLRREGKTVVLASHNLEMISSYCSRALWLDGGAVRREGPAAEVAAAYQDAAMAPSA
jgi:ABC-type polysaccharide/polyol phosphate transport system ATPase subunit